MIQIHGQKGQDSFGIAANAGFKGNLLPREYVVTDIYRDEKVEVCRFSQIAEPTVRDIGFATWGAVRRCSCVE